MRISDWSSDVCSSDLAGSICGDTLSAGVRLLMVIVSPFGERCRRSQPIDRYLEIGDAIVLRGRQAPRPHIDLYRRQQQPRHREFGIARAAASDELVFGDTVARVDVCGTLLGDGRLPAVLLPLRGQIVVAQDRKSTRLNSSH